jgi:HPt (histidine-containing phosphotransfer) domain-containing protein
MSIDAIRAKLLPKFIASSKERVVKARSAIADGLPSKIRDEMHAITGDAGMIGQPAIGDLARTVSGHAKAWESGNLDEKPACETALNELSARLDALATPG